MLDRETVLRAVSSLRQEIMSWPVPDWAKDARSELALDVCVFARYTSTVLGNASSRPRTKRKAERPRFDGPD
jgi:hypothetical protein